MKDRIKELLNTLEQELTNGLNNLQSIKNFG